MEVSAAGIGAVSVFNNMLSGAATDFKLSGGFLYATDGSLLNTDPVNAMPFTGSTGLVLTDAATKRLCWLQQSGSTATLHVHEQSPYGRRIGGLPLTGLNGTATSLVPAGGDRVAFRTTAGQLFIVRSELLGTASTRMRVTPQSPLLMTRQLGQNTTTPSEIKFTVANLGGGTLNWQSSFVPWLDVWTLPLVLGDRQVQDLVLQPNSLAQSLPPGDHTATLSFTNQTNGLGNESFTVTLRVLATNSAPTITSITNQTTGGDSPIGPLSFTVGDAETTAAALTMSAVSSDTTLIPHSGIVFGGSGASRTVTLTAVPGRSGTAGITVTVSDGLATASTTFNVTVNAVNDAPTISTISSPVCSEDPSVTGLAFTISDPESPSGDLVVSATSSNPALIPASRIYFGGSGNARTLSLVPLPDQNGSASITISVSDGQLSASRTFTLTVNAVNDAPTLNPPAALLLPVSSPTQMVNLTGISSGAANETQNLVITATSSNTLVVPHPGVIYSSAASTGTLSISPLAGATGSAAINVTVHDGSIATVRSFPVRVGVPVISNFTPASGPAGTLVTITGDGFDPVPATNAVYFGAVRAPVLSASTTQLTVFAPAGATNKPLSVTARGLTAQATKAFRITFANTRPFAADAFGPVQFLPKTIHTSFIERRVLTADLDGNGSADILAKGATGFEFTTNQIADGVLHPGAFDPLAQVPHVSTINGMIHWDYGDLDGDTRLDVVACGDTGVWIFRNTGGSPLFAPRVQLSTTYASVVLISDVDGDGKPEILAAESPSVAVFRNTSTTAGLSFAPRIQLPPSTMAASSLILEDMDGDGRRDIVAGIVPSAQVYRATGTLPLATSSFAAPVSFATSTASTGHRVAVADFDGDGKCDIACAGFPTGASAVNPGTLGFFRNTSTPGSITMEPRVDMAVPPQPSGVESADLDGDGLADLLVTSYGQVSQSAAVWKNSNTPGSLTAAAFGTRIDLPGNIGGSLMGAMTGDLDGDGRPEIVIGSAGQRVMVWKNQFGDSQPLITAMSPSSGPVGTEVTLTGSGFASVTGGNVVYFGSRRANVLSASANSLTVSVPEGATADAISVTVNGTTALSPEVFKTTLITTRVLSAGSYRPGAVVGSTVLDTFTYPNPISVVDVDDDGFNDVVMTRTVAYCVLMVRN
ncbi:MAG: FG-GAP-like repeat-containing protein, partial [Prosthecobacter sp.]